MSNGFISEIISHRQSALDWVSEQITDHFRENYWKIDPKQLRSDLEYFLRFNDDKSSDELGELARRLSPGGVHTAGLLTRYVMENVGFPDPTLVVALLYYNWKGGKRGFQFLPHYSDVPLEEYVESVCSLESWLEQIHPTRILSNRFSDLDFYNSLPESFTAYRGGNGSTPEALAAGMCWSTSRSVSEWFANRGLDNEEPILVSARVQKSWVRLAFASEFEVVLTPIHWRQLKCPVRPSNWRPTMNWAAQDELSQAA